PPGGGPVVGIAAGAALLPADVARVAVLSCDLPFLTPTVLSGLCASLDEGGDVALLLDGSGRPQWLCTVWRRAALARRLEAAGVPIGGRLCYLVGQADVRGMSVTDTTGPPPWFDCDTDDDIRRAEEWIHADPR